MIRPLHLKRDLRKNKSPFCLTIAALAGLSFAGAMAAGTPVAWWSFDADGGRQDAILGQELVPGVRGQALRSNEFETVIECAPASLPPMKTGELAMEAWIAPRAYPWNYCPILEQRDATKGFYFGINYQGQLQLFVSLGGKWVHCESRQALPGLDENVRFAGENAKSAAKPADFGDVRENPSIPLLKWTHVAGSVGADGTVRIYINGALAGEAQGSGRFEPADTKPLVLARTTEPVMPLYLARPKYNIPHFCSFDGLLDEIKLYDRALGKADVLKNFQSVQLANPQPLQFRRLPTAQDLPGPFGAFYTKFKYDEDWDRDRRMGEAQDVFVRFDNNPCTFVCWNGTEYPAFYPEGGNVGQTFEDFESWSKDGGCHEAMEDRLSKYMTWRILENTPARVVLQWRHMLVSANNLPIYPDPNTGWSDWVDDYYTIYPDTVCARRTTLWSSKPVWNHSYAQDNSILQPGFMPWDVYEKEPLSVANLDGQETIQTMGKGHHGPKDPAFQQPAVIQRHNFKTRWKPFMIAPPHEVFGGEWTNNMSWPWYLPCWHHWPTALLIEGDGSCTFVENGRPKSSCLTNGWGYGDVKTKAVVVTKNSLTRFSLIGMTDGSTAALAPLARSYRQAPEASTASAGFRCDGFSVADKAFHLARVSDDAAQTLAVSIDASNHSPLVNPAFVISNWGDRPVAVSINGEAVKIGEACRIGFHDTPSGRDLIVWLKFSAESPTTFGFEYAAAASQ